MSNAILIVLDPQMVYFTEGLLPVHNAEQTIKNIATIADNFYGSTVLIRHIEPAGPFSLEDEAHSKFHPLLENTLFAQVFHKTEASAFVATGLDAWLTKHSTPSEIVVVGYQSHHCVLATALEAAAYGNVSVVTDACSSPSLMRVCADWDRTRANPNCGMIDGKEVHEMAMAACCQFRCTPLTTAECLSKFA
jgi:nicotinamidase-related amidase